MVASLLGLPDLGPVVLLLRTPAAQVAAPACSFGTEGFRLVIGGSYSLDGRERTMGDMRLQAADTLWEPVIAGPDGLDEVVILGDRRGASPTVHGERRRGSVGSATSMLCSTGCAAGYKSWPDARSSTSADRLTLPAPLRGIRSTVSNDFGTL